MLTDDELSSDSDSDIEPEMPGGEWKAVLYYVYYVCMCSFVSLLIVCSVCFYVLMLCLHVGRNTPTPYLFICTCNVFPQIKAFLNKRQPPLYAGYRLRYVAYYYYIVCST